MTRIPFKVSRRICENIWSYRKLTSKQTRIIQKSKQKVNRKQSDFSKRLQNRKKLSLFYGNLPVYKIQQNKVATYLDKQKGLLINLESRLDVILVRAHFCLTLFTARQLIMHRKIYVNFQVVNYPGFHVSNGDIISLSQSCIDFVKSMMFKNNSPRASHLEINYKTYCIVLLYEPYQVQFPYRIELDLV